MVSALYSGEVIKLTTHDRTDHRDRYKSGGKDVHESPEPEPPSYEIGMTGFSIRESRLDYEASIHVEALGYQRIETIACGEGIGGV
jgi:hypothetical protein